MTPIYVFALLAAVVGLGGGTVGAVFVARRTPRREWLIALCVLCATFGGLFLVVLVGASLIPPVT